MWFLNEILRIHDETSRRMDAARLSHQRRLENMFVSTREEVRLKGVAVSTEVLNQVRLQTDAKMAEILAESREEIRSLKQDGIEKWNRIVRRQYAVAVMTMLLFTALGFGLGHFWH